MFRLYGDGDYRAGLNVVMEAEPRFPERASDILFWRMCLHSMVGEQPESLEAFRTSLEAGHFYGGEALADADLDSVRETAEFRELEVRSLDMTAAAEGSDAAPTVIRPPAGVPAKGLVGFFHGAGANPSDHQEYWSPVAETGWTVAILRGDVVFTSDRWAWSFETGPKRAVAHLAGMLADEGHEALLLAGFSQGAGLACYLDHTGALGSDGLVLLAPSFRYFGMPLHLEGRKTTPIWVSIGGEDRVLDESAGFVAHCADCGVSSRLDVHEGLGHDYPPNMAAVVDSAALWFEELGD